MLTDSTYREEFLEEVTGELRSVFAVRGRVPAVARRRRPRADRLPAWHSARQSLVPGFTHQPGPPLRLDRAAEPARLPWHRRLRGAGLRARRRRLLLLLRVRGPVADALHQRPDRPARGELPGADRRAAAAATAADPDEAWALARGIVDEGRPALLITDLFHLDHYGNSAHFPGHAVVLAGYDDEYAYVSDTGFEELQRTSLEGLAQGPPRAASVLPARRPHGRRPRGGADRRGAARGGAGGDRARRPADARARLGRVRGPARAAPLRRRGRRLARGRRRTGSGRRASTTR